MCEGSRIPSVVERSDHHPAAELLPPIYGDLRKLAARKLAHAALGQTLQATALVHEAYLRLAAAGERHWEGTRHFFFAASRAMHDILVEHVRQKCSLKRGGGRRQLDLDELTIAHNCRTDDTFALAEALRELEKLDPRKHRLVLLRFFGGCTTEQVAAAMELSASTIAREWRFARAWLQKRLSDASDRS